MNNPFETIDAKLSTIENLLLDLKHGQLPTETPEGNDLLTIKQTAEFLNLAVPTIYSMVSRKEIPYMKKAKRLYFSKSELMTWLQSGRKMTLQEMQERATEYLKH